MSHHECLFMVPASDLLRRRVDDINEKIKGKKNVRLDLAGPDENGLVYVDVFYDDNVRTGKKPGKKRMIISAQRPLYAGEVRAMIRDLGPAGAARKLGIGQATMYRRLRECKSDEDLLI